MKFKVGDTCVLKALPPGDFEADEVKVGATVTVLRVDAGDTRGLVYELNVPLRDHFFFPNLWARESDLELASAEAAKS